MNDVDVDTLSYKELQALAMSLSLPGKMKQGLLVDAIKARQSGNESVVSVIIAANRQRTVVRRQQQYQREEDQIIKFNEELARKRARSRRFKRSACEMDPDVKAEDVPPSLKRSRLMGSYGNFHHQRPHYYASTGSLHWQQQQDPPPAPMPPQLTSLASLESPETIAGTESSCSFSSPPQSLCGVDFIGPSLSECSTITADSYDEKLPIPAADSGAFWPSAGDPLDSDDTSRWDLTTWRSLPNLKLGDPLSSYHSADPGEPSYFHQFSDDILNNFCRPEEVLSALLPEALPPACCQSTERQDRDPPLQQVGYRSATEWLFSELQLPFLVISKYQLQRAVDSPASITVFRSDTPTNVTFTSNYPRLTTFVH